MHALRTEVVERLSRVFAQILLQDHNRGNLAGLRQLIVHDSRICADKCDDAGSTTREATHPLQQSRVSSHGLVDDNLGGTQDPGLTVRAPRAPLTRRRERNVPLRASLSARQCILVEERPDGLRGRVRAVTRRSRERTANECLVARDHVDLAHADAAGGERARLIQAQAVDAGEHFDGRKFLHEDPAPGQRRRPNREVHRSQEYEALGDHADDRGNRQDQGFSPVPA